MCVVCCQHGDELIGKFVFDYFSKDIDRFPGLKIIFANEEAFKKRVRFTDEDLNRSYPGNINGSSEARLAARILKECVDAPCVLDLHTTTSSVSMTPIIAKLTAQSKRILNLTSAKRIVIMDEKMAGNSLIGNLLNGVSFEYNENEAKRPTIKTDLVQVITGYLDGRRKPQKMRELYQVNKLIDNRIKLPKTAKNFQKLSNQPIIPFLIGEKAYVTFQGFSLSPPTHELI